MESWIRTLIEWINCLNICEKPISHIQQLRNNDIFYSKLIRKLKQSNGEQNDREFHVLEFIKEEYPEVVIDKNEIDDEAGQVFFTSLLLLSASQKVSLHRPMYSLSNETQVLIKRFLELILPYGKDVTLDTIRDTILEFGDSTPINPPQTPKDRLLKTFLTSPAAQSNYRHKVINERDKQLRLLRAQLETEQFEKADLQDDIQKLEDKINNLQKKLKHKTEELKSLRAERTAPITPASTRKKKKNDDEIEVFWKKEIQHLEAFNSKLQANIDHLEDEQQNLTRLIASKDRVNTSLRVKIEEYERELEASTAQLEIKTNELLDFRMQNEELRTHIQKMQDKHSTDAEQSFEVENVWRIRSPTPNLNTSEAASSIIDIQLRESHEEAARLKADLNSLQDKLDEALNQCQELKSDNELLNEKILGLNEVQMTLEITEDKLSKRDCQLHIMEMEKKTLQDELKKLQDTINHDKELLDMAENKKSELESEIVKLKEEVNALQMSVVTTQDSLEQISASKDVLDMKLQVAEQKINLLEKSILDKTAQYDELSRTSQDKISKLKKNMTASMNEKKQLEENLLQKNDEIKRIFKELADKNSMKTLLESNICHLKDELNSNQKILSEKETKLCELNELRDELQSQLIQEQEKTTKLFERKCELEFNSSTIEATNSKLTGELTASQLSLNKLQQRYDDLEKKLKKEEEKYMNQKEKADIFNCEKENLLDQLHNLNVEVSHLKTIQENLENRLTQEQEYCMKLVMEKSDLEHTLALSERQNSERSEGISMLQLVLEKSNAELKELKIQYDNCKVTCTEANDNIENLSGTITKLNSNQDQLKKNITDLEEITISLKNQLKISRDREEILSSEKSALELVLMSRDNDKKELMEKIYGLESDSKASQEDVKNMNCNYKILQEKLEDAEQKIVELSEEKITVNTKCEEITEERDSLLEKLNEVTVEMNLHEAKSKELQLQIEEMQLSKERLTQVHQTHQDASDELIESLQKRLLATQNTCETLKLEAKLQEESAIALKSKLEILTNDKLQSEIKLKEITKNLHELTSCQEFVLDAHAKALADKTAEFHILEEQYKKIQEKLQIKLDHQDACNSKLSTELQTLQDMNSKNIEIIAKMEQIRSEEMNRMKELEKKYETLESDIKLIEESYGTTNKNDGDDKDLKTTLNHPVAQKLTKIIDNIYQEVEANNKKIIELQEENQNLKKNIETNEMRIEAARADEKSASELLNRMNTMEIEWNKRNMLLSDLIHKKENLKVLLDEVIKIHDETETKIFKLRESFNEISSEIRLNIATNSSACDEVKHMEALRVEIEKLLNDLVDRHIKNIQPRMKVLCGMYMWSENKLNEYSTAPLIKLESDILEVNLSDEMSVLQAEIETNEKMEKDLLKIEMKINNLRIVSESHKINMKPGIVKREMNTENKLQMQLDKLMKEKKDLKDKMDASRVRNAKMEKNIDELRNENKKMKAELSEFLSKDKSELSRFATENEQLLKDIENLKKEKAELEKRPKHEDFDARLKDVHNEYDEKLERIKQKMKIAYNEQIAKINAEQGKAMAEKTAEMRAKMEQQCKKYSEDIAKYKAHISQMSSQFWDVGEKLLVEKQEKETAMQRLKEVQAKHQQALNEANQSFQAALAQNQFNPPNISKDYHLDHGLEIPSRSSFRTVRVIEEQTTTTRRHSVKSIQAMGNAFNAADEEGEVFDNVYLTDLKEGKFRGADPALDLDRMSELRLRNSLCRPHLKSSYAVETNFHPLPLTEEEIKGGPTNDDTFNDSLSQSLLPSHKVKKKDRTQTSYKRPGPPTPSKNGGRLSLQGNEFRSPNSRILKEKNIERRTTATPKRLKDFFVTSLTRRQDENTPATTPKGRRLSNIFRKTRPV